MAIVGPPRTDEFLDPVVEALRQSGCETLRCSTIGEAVRHQVRQRIGAIVILGAGLFAQAASFPNLRLIASPIVSTEDLDLASATALDVAIANGRSSANADSMAEATILLMLAALYDLRRSETVLRESLPRQAPFARTLAGRTIGLVGFGDIAEAIAARLSGWDVRIVAYARRPVPDLPANVRQVDLDDLLQASDVVALLSRLSDETRGMVGEHRLARLKPGAVLVNTGRGELVDEDALARVLRERPDLFAALDTFTVEPLPENSPLRQLPNVILTPHCVGHTQDAVRGLHRQTVRNVVAALRGELPPGLCNPEVAARWRDRFGCSS